jgi:hypothetical protein
VSLLALALLLAGPASGEEPLHDVPTVLAIGSTSYLLAAVVHEGVGHETACWATSGDLQGFSLANAGCDPETPWVSAGGTIANVAVGGAFSLTLALSPPRDANTYAFLWTSAAADLFQAGGYLLVGPWVGAGDWGTGGVLEGAAHPLPWQVGISAAGLGLSAGAVLLTNRLGQPLLGSLPRQRRMIWVPYLAGSSLVTAGSLLNRAGPEYAVSAGMANFAGTLFFAYIPLFFHDGFWTPGPAAEGDLLTVHRSPLWWGIGLATAATAVAVLGPGVGDYPTPHPLFDGQQVATALRPDLTRSPPGPYR